MSEKNNISVESMDDLAESKPNLYKEILKEFPNNITSVFEESRKSQESAIDSLKEMAEGTVEFYKKAVSEAENDETIEELGVQFKELRKEEIKSNEGMNTSNLAFWGTAVSQAVLPALAPWIAEYWGE